jgi:hypothetical protein
LKNPNPVTLSLRLTVGKPRFRRLPFLAALGVPRVCASLVELFDSVISVPVGRLTANQPQIADLLRVWSVWCAGCGPDVKVGDGERDRVYCAIALPDILEEPGRLTPADNE